MNACFDDWETSEAKDNYAGWTALCRTLRVCENLTKINLSDMGIGPTALTALSGALVDQRLQTQLQTIILDRNKKMVPLQKDGEGDESHCDGFRALCSAIATSSVSTLSVCGCTLNGTSGALSTLAENLFCRAELQHLGQKSQLKSLFLDLNNITAGEQNRFTDVGLTSLLRALKSSALTELSMSGCSLDHRGLSALSSDLRGTPVVILNISNNPKILGESDYLGKLSLSGMSAKKVLLLSIHCH